MGQVRVAIIGDFDPEYPIHRATNAALDISGRKLAVTVDHEWLGTDSVAPGDAGRLDAFDGVWVAPGGPYRSLDGALWAIRTARECDIPLIGT